MDRKHWGFTANHLTIMFVAVVVALMPGSLWAVANYQRVAIQDPQSGKKSEIDKQRRLRVYDAQLAADELPNKFVRFIVGVGSTCVPVATPPAGKALIVKSLNVDVSYLPSPPNEYLGLYVGATCSGLVGYVDPASVGPYPLSFEPGLVVPNGQSLWAKTSSSAINAFVNGTGYLVPKSSAPASVSLNASEASVIRE